MLRFRGSLLPITFGLLSGCTLLQPVAPKDQSKKTLDLSVERTRSVTMDPEMERASEAYRLYLSGQLQFSAEDYTAARRSLRRASALVTEPAPALHARLAELELKQGDLKEALAESAKALDVPSPDPRTLILHAGILDSLNRGTEALPFYEQAVKEEPNKLDGYILLSALHLKLGEPQKAVVVLKDYVARFPEDPLPRYFLGRAYEAAGDLSHAEQDIKRAFEVTPNNTTLGVDYARILLKARKFPAAIAVCRKILEHDSKNIPARKILGTLLVSENQLDEALEQFQALGAEEEDPTDTLFKIALIQIQKQRLPEAEQGLQLLLARSPQHAASRYYLATIFSSTSRAADAIEQLNLIPESDSLYPKAQAFASYVARSTGDIDGALRAIKNAYRVDKGDNPQIFGYLISLLRQRGDFTEAKTELERRLAAHPTSADDLYDYAMVLHDIGDNAAAFQAASRLITIAPNHPDALNFVAYSLAERNEQLSQAERYIRRALKVRPREAYFYDTLGWVLYKRAKYKASVAALVKALEFLGQDSVVLEHYGDALAAIGQKGEAERVFQRAIDSYRAGQGKQENLRQIELLQNKIQKLH